MKKRKLRVNKPVFTNISLFGRFISISTDENGFLVLPDFVENNNFLKERVISYLSNFVKVEQVDDSEENTLEEQGGLKRSEQKAEETISEVREEKSDLDSSVSPKDTSSENASETKNKRTRRKTS